MAKKRTRRYQHGCLRVSPDGRRWIVKFYYAPGKQTTKTLGLKSEINRRQAEILRDEIIRPINLNPLRSKTEETFERFVEDVFLADENEIGEWRENTAKESTREIRSHLLPDLGEIKFEELTAGTAAGDLEEEGRARTGPPGAEPSPRISDRHLPLRNR